MSGVADVYVLGVRHHGPGSARAVATVLEEVRPEAVLIEGAPELTDVLSLAASTGMRPPVAGLVYAPAQPRRAAFYPLAVFSPEWVALRWALSHGAEVSFADLGATHQLAPTKAAARSSPPDDREPEGDGDQAEAGFRGEDPITVLATAAGFDDPERWWEDTVEHRHHGLDIFQAITDAMVELRQTDGLVATDPSCAPREAAMRKALRAAMRRHDRVAFVCGAWHAPALHPEAFPTIRHDNDLLKGLPKIKVAATWVPWTNSRLSYRSGYGAGVTSPGWYEHLFSSPEHVTERWLTRTARLLREEQLSASSASVIEAARLADTLAVMRGRPSVGIAELTDATQAALCEGSVEPLALVAERLFVGDSLGHVPDDTPMVPLAKDLERQQRRLRLKPSADEKTIVLDLRSSTHRERSHLLRRLNLLGVRWGALTDTGRTGGTFKEAWRLLWQPELSVALIEASGRGNTIAEAATSTLRRQVSDADLAQLTELVEQAMLADLPEALRAAMDVLAERAARQHDTLALMAAVEPLARIARYGTVRDVDTRAVGTVLRGVSTRVAVGLGAACSSLDDEAAATMRSLIDRVHRGLAIVNDPEQRDGWYGALAGLADQAGVHGVVAGRATRLLLDGARLAPEEAGRRLSLSLSRGADTVRGAAWLDGFLAGDATLLLHDPALLGVVDDWLTNVPDELFDDLLPLVRRTFSQLSRPERRQIGERLSSSPGTGTDPASEAGAQDAAGAIDPERGRRAAPVLRQILQRTP